MHLLNYYATYGHVLAHYNVFWLILCINQRAYMDMLSFHRQCTHFLATGLGIET